MGLLKLFRRRRKHLLAQNIIRDEDISQQEIPKKFSEEQERKFRANIVRYCGEEDARIIIEARQQAYDDLNEGRAQEKSILRMMWK